MPSDDLSGLESFLSEHRQHSQQQQLSTVPGDCLSGLENFLSEQQQEHLQGSSSMSRIHSAPLAAMDPQSALPPQASRPPQAQPSLRSLPCLEVRLPPLTVKTAGELVTMAAAAGGLLASCGGGGGGEGTARLFQWGRAEGNIRAPDGIPEDTRPEGQDSDMAPSLEILDRSVDEVSSVADRERKGRKVLIPDMQTARCRVSMPMSWRRWYGQATR